MVLGEYGIEVIKGQITFLGATITASKIVHNVYAPSSHSLPVIRFRASETGIAELRLHQNSNGLSSLKQLSPLFAGIWNTKTDCFDPDILSQSEKEPAPVSKRTSYQIVRMS